MSFQPATEQEAPPTILAVDLGKTSCRVRVTRGAEVLGESTGEGAPGLAEDNAALSHRAILRAVERLGAIAGPDKKLLTSIESIGIGAAGVEAASDDTGQVCVTGGLASQPHFRARLDSALRTSGLTTIPPLGDALNGAAVVAGNRRLPYEGRIIRG